MIEENYAQDVINRQKIIDEVSLYIRKGLYENVFANGSIIKNEANIENIKNTLITISKDLQNRGLIPEMKLNTVDIDVGRDKVFKVSYKDQLNSINFITGVDEVKSVYYTARSEFEARGIAEGHLCSSCKILSIELDHEVLDYSRLDINLAIPIYPKNIIITTVAV